MTSLLESEHCPVKLQGGHAHPKSSRGGRHSTIRPIELINVIFKFVAKAFALRLGPIAHRTISNTQSVFIKGWLIHEGIVYLQEIIHES